METPEEMLEAIETAISIAPRNGGLELDDWETNFIDSIIRQLHKGHSLTEKQTDKLTEIWDKT